MAETAIAPTPTALGVNQAYVAQAPTFLVMKERVSLSGDDFTIRTTTGQDVIRCEGKYMSMSGRKVSTPPQNVTALANIIVHVLTDNPVGISHPTRSTPLHAQSQALLYTQKLVPGVPDRRQILLLGWKVSCKWSSFFHNINHLF